MKRAVDNAKAVPIMTPSGGQDLLRAPTIRELLDLFGHLSNLPKLPRGGRRLDDELHWRLTKFFWACLWIEGMRGEPARRRRRIERLLLDGKEVLLKEEVEVTQLDLARAVWFMHCIAAAGWDKAGDEAAKYSKGMYWEGGAETMRKAYEKFQNALPPKHRRRPRTYLR
jgi:hypothetical protein